MLPLRIIMWLGYGAMVILAIIGLLMFGAPRSSDQALAPWMLAGSIVSGLSAAFFGALDRIIVLLAADRSHSNIPENT